jgi:translation initiation factor IF-3
MDACEEYKPLKHNNKREKTLPINERIRAAQVQLITQTGENVGLVARDQALGMARDVGLDLVLLSEQGATGVPVAKIMDFGKSLYEKKKRQNKTKKHQKVIQIKEIKFRPKIGEHDYQTKMKQMVEFLQKGKRVKVSLFFKGRENANRSERAAELFGKINTTLQEYVLLDNIIQEKDSPGGIWSRVYYLKNV